MVTHLLGVVVFRARDGVTAPADHRSRREVRVQHARMLEDVEDRVGNPFRAGEIEEVRVGDVRADVNDVAQHGEQVLTHTFDHPLADGDRKIRVGFEDGGRVIGLATGIQHRQRALTEEIVEPGLPGGIREDVDLPLRQQLQRTPRPDRDIYFLLRS